ncbi:ATP-dependent DNA helicase UvrD2 [Corynebacterium pseudodiphtheriticum]|uniref:ATP-dependent DNA helicase UvrD2 n=1 Tax=Corynebacterium pseudodiphtheriticum TaxID=37637 RepID=UPI00234DE2D0|nr:ATP-dependent DNA helicase UvrD2 [Corynebacterium pseudodiphtheriticum]MDC7089160.1 ATP-dependent DNA helicase UvrD2 [Corynebacterium pseudodiphtheriticum]MDK4241861.1 ATP-dependent DNA helicase UvrD2 [Corynebacterium pseudodiphtheriticum]MDK4322281.1 ATP-dependent DNA helicase UvrD2 [Corynebacterium pseudodiphtheriticum]MDK8478053.1 ATP-dependent DNA helicase UvrD2 [Corynebacterium pseudodiphtheriticum]MDK8487116.1 ATP-dependent DNA helicase UvrD2 [Corynebacterium pseudodiphtheriticum]
MVNLDVLDDDQRAAATAPRGPVAIIAGAGTGKTRTITYRIAHLIDQGFATTNSVLALTYTSRAAGEMRDRLASMNIGGVQAMTFHAAARRQLRYFWPQIAGDVKWKLLDSAFPVVARAARSVTNAPSKDTIRDLLNEIEWAKSSLLGADGYAAYVDSIDRTPPLPAEQVAEVYRRYEQLKTSDEGMHLDFSDLLLHVAGAMENAPAVAEEFRQRYRTFVVDEYQDVTPLQQRVLEGWLGDRDDLTVVGDANQTIYSFTGATPQYLLDFSRHFPNAHVVKLQRDYRSTPQVTTLANQVIGAAKGRIAGTRLELQGMREPGPEPIFREFESDPAEAREIAGQILTLLDQGVPAKEIAVLYRINAQSAVLEQALADAGIAYQVRGGTSFFENRVIVDAMQQLIRANLQNDLPPDPVAIARAALAPLGYSTQEPDGAQERERWQLLRALVDLVEDIVQLRNTDSLEVVLGELRRRAADKQPPAVDSVTLVTLHAAKGLEWDAVFLAGLTEGLLPFRYAIDAGDEQIEEERRLFYVGITRARKHLALSWAPARQEGGRASRKRTRFLDGLVAQSTREEPSAARVRKTKKCRVCREALTTPGEKVVGRHAECESPGNEDLFGQLRGWRARVAREEQVPAYIIFSDATLQAISEALPTTVDELYAISGIGQKKAELFGQDLLDIVRQYA